MKHNALQLAVEIKTSTGSVLKPSEIHFWDIQSSQAPAHVKKLEAHSPFKFYTDAILALCFHKLTKFKYVNAEQHDFADKSYHFFDHYTELFNKSAPRVKSLAQKNVSHQKHVDEFEKKVSHSLDVAFASNKVSIHHLVDVLNHISDFETQISAPLIYNFSVHFSAEFTEKLICFYSFLFHLRSVVAIDHNAHAEDSSHESVTCDSITDYLAKADYTVNDALLYWHFKNLSSPFTNSKTGQKNVGVENQLVLPMLGHFHQYNHNACHLIDQLPEKFLLSLNDHDLEDALHHVQMDWLLGSASGLLFKVREELYGVVEGYDKIFWTHCSGLKSKKASVLNLSFELNAKHVHSQKAA